MKNLSAIPRLSLSETFTILITLVVCLAGFTEAEVYTEYRRQDSNQQAENYNVKEASLKRSVPYAHQMSKLTDSESEDRNVGSFKNIPGLPLNKLIKRHSDDFGESDESDEKESDGYGYDDDEYYHFNFKRNDEHLDTAKIEKEGTHDSKLKQADNNPLQNPSSNEKSKEMETIEMLNFKESHPPVDAEDHSMTNAKSFSEQIGRKANSNPNLPTSLKMSDLRGNSAIDEKMKDRKDESGLSSGSSETKIADSKKSVKASEDKDNVKLKDAKLTQDTEPKDKESLKDGKEAVVGKNMKDTSKSAEEKEKGVKLSESAKLEDSLEKISDKTKNESPKFTKDMDNSKYTEKLGSDAISPTGLNEINNRASFVSNDYKDSSDAMKTAGVEEDIKTSDESSGVGLNDYLEDWGRSPETVSNLYNHMDVERSQNYGALRPGNQMFRDMGVKEYAQLAMGLQNNEHSSDEFKKESGLDHVKFLAQQTLRRQSQQQQQRQLSPITYLEDQQQAQQRQEASSNPRYKTYGFSFPASELENTDYHKNYIKSLKRYKGLNAEQKGIVPSDSSSSSGSHTTQYDETGNKKLQEAVKRRSTEIRLEQKENAQSGLQKFRRNTYKADSSQSQESAAQSFTCGRDDTKLAEAKKPESSRARRKSPIKVEYEIKVIDPNQQNLKSTELSRMMSKRFEKDVKTKLAPEEKYLKKYPYSQVSRDDLTRAGDSEAERKFKRKAPVWKRHDKKSIIQTRAVPSGYYGNRVKFGQKSYARSNDLTNVDSSDLESGHVLSSYVIESHPPTIDKPKMLRSWDVRQQDYKHDPMKRYDESGSNKGNSLLLVRKGERTTTTFDDGSQWNSETNLIADNLAKILSKDKDYLVLKKTDSNKFQKISESSYPNTVHLDSSLIYSSIVDEAEQAVDSMKGNIKQALKNKELHVRSFHPEKEDKKFSSASHGSKSNLKKTFDKFRDLAGFFKDNEQESTDNQYSAQELKEGRDIVFSEDKLPDPIVISNDGTAKNMGFSQKQPNSIYSISTNFKTLDQQDKKTDVPTSYTPDKNMFTSEAKSDNSESSWEPTLKNIFPEAKSINAMSKNGNEIIILDLNRNQLKSDHSYSNSAAKQQQQQQQPQQQQQYGTCGQMSQVPDNSLPLNDNTVQMMLNSNQLKLQTVNKTPQKNIYSNKARNAKAYALVRTSDNINQVSIRELSDLPSLLRALTEKPNLKQLTKRSLPINPENTLSENYKKFLTDLNELSELSKSNYRKGKLTEKRSSEDMVLPSTSLPEMSNYGEAKVKYLGSLLQNIKKGENPEFKSFGGDPSESSNYGIPKSVVKRLSSNQLYLNPGVPEPERNTKYQRRRSTATEKSRNYRNEAESNLLRSDVEISGDKNYQDELLAEIAAASDKINRLRREGVGARKLRKAIEDSLVFRGKPGTENESPQEKCSKLDSDSIGSSAGDKIAFGPELKSEHETKESSDGEFLKPNYENQLNEFFENLNPNKNQKDQLSIPNENTWKRKKRKENHRRKRSASGDVKNKVSTTEVQNRILENLAEDNYQSVYSPGIKRRLFSTNNEADEADNYRDAYERDKNVIAEEAQPKCVKNSLNNCIDPMIVELFGAVDEEEKNRARRSLTSGFHSNFKREIDLDESMPNDFQNFLVTSLGGFGSQNREAIKKDVALWERKESAQDANQNAESPASGGKEDPNSNLEKREVSSSENRKGQTYFQTDSNSNLVSVLSPLNHADKVRSDLKSKLKTKAEFVDEKHPTQIRIQITNASSKEKKCSKPIMDDSETTATEIENLPKKEFFDKNKITTLRLNNLPKLHSLPKSKISFSDYEETDKTDTFRGHRRRRKKKKYVPENPAKPIKDFIKFDQKTMETFLKRILSDQSMTSDQTTQKSPVSNHLPQVETVYNPTQGTNKAQLETFRFGKINTANNKNMGTVKNNLISSDSMGYDDVILQSYMKEKPSKLKSDKVKEYESIDWKPTLGQKRLKQDIGWEPSNSNFNLQTLKTSMRDSSSAYNLNSEPSRYLDSFNQKIHSNCYIHPPSMSSEGSNTLYDALKLKQEMKNGLIDHTASKIFKKPYLYNSPGFYKPDRYRNPRIPLSDFSTLGDGSWNYEYGFKKKSGYRGFKGRDFFTPGLKSQNRFSPKGKFTRNGKRKLMKNLDDEKWSMMEPFQDNIRDMDYQDKLGSDEEYLDDDTMKEMPTENPMSSMLSRYNRLYNFDPEEEGNDEEEETDEDYDEAGEEEDAEDYSLLANTQMMDPELPKSDHKRFRPQEDAGFAQGNYLYPKTSGLLRGRDFEQAKFTNSKMDTMFSQIPLTDLKSDLGSISSSTSLLQKANENSNIFGGNLMKSMFTYSPENGETQENNMKDLKGLYHSKLFKRKMDYKEKHKRSSPQIGSRFFYASKTEMGDEDSSLPRSYGFHSKQKRSRNAYCHRNPLNAEFADPVNNFDNEFEENGNNNLRNFGKNLLEGEKTDKNVAWDDDAGLDDVAENFEDDGETISEDNILENVIGKYIMRKRVASPTDLYKAESSQVEGKHSLRKRSLGKQKSEKTRDVKVVKRLSSGHLTESNFRKFHKKNLTRKREVNEFDFGNVVDGRAFLTKTRKRENSSQRKRSALDIFKKITNKDRDNKKVESIDGRTAGFEPLSSLDDKKYESSIRDAKLEFLNQVKKLSNESPQTQIKSSIIELKPRVPSESQLEADQRRKLKLSIKEAPAMTGQGPWRIELNEKYDVKLEDFRKNLDKLKEVVPISQDNENLKAFLVFSDNLRTIKGSEAENLSPTSGSSQKEVGTCYRPKSDEGRGIYKLHVSKRSLDSSLVATNAEDAARDHFISEQITETNIEKNRALHDTKSLSEGDSKPQPPHVLQRNTKKIRSFVNNNEQCPNARFPSVGRLSNRKSVFPPSDDENHILVKSEKVKPSRKINKRLTNPSQIMRDSRQVNEETSKYLGQQIVDAILSHVSENPKFKELIAPGLAARTASKEDVRVKKGPLRQVDISDQLQYFLHKFMVDVEKLAEKHVRKRMCTQIDQQSKDFLQSLLSVPRNTDSSDESSDDDNCSPSDDYFDVETSAEVPVAVTTKAPKPLKETAPPVDNDNLMKKHCLLLKLIDDYDKLSKMEKETLRAKYKYLLVELELSNHQLGSLNSGVNASVVDVCKNKTEKSPTDKVFENFLKNNVTWSSENCTTTSPQQDWHEYSHQTESTTPNPTNGNCSVKPECTPLPTISLEDTFTITEKSTVPTFPEGLGSLNTTFYGKSKYQTSKQNSPAIVADGFHKFPPPESFDLLPLKNSSKYINSIPIQQPLGSSGNNRFHNFLPEDGNFDILDRYNPNSLTELHKLSLGDAAGLQLSLKYRGPWVSNLDVAKSIRNVPLPLRQSPFLSKTDLGWSQQVPTDDGSPADTPSVADVKNSRSSFVPSNDFSNYGAEMAKGNGLTFTCFPHLNFGMLEPKSGSFDSANRTPLKAVFKKFSECGKKLSHDEHIETQSPNIPGNPPKVPSNCEILPLIRKTEDIFKKISHHKKNRFLSELPLHLQKHKKNKKRKASMGRINNDESADKDDDMEYLAWSKMPAIRRQLNKLEAGLELDEFFLKNSKLKMPKRGEDNPV